MLTNHKASELLSPDRRQFLLKASVLGGATAAGLLFPPGVLANDFWQRPRTLYLRRAGTDELIRETYWADGSIVGPGYRRVCHLLRDVKAGVATDMSPRLLDILAGIQGWFRSYKQDRLIVVTSGLRTETTNANTEGAVKNSRHKTGGAADITIPDVPADYLAKLGLYLQGGGVGWYPNRHFVHVDDWRQRFWKG
ncbi:YcbK family protein [Bordetella flabilis]|uniref:Murein endopeptidase K n=1 Tax=Bordetella flabilis TaxID=463014 RepID=A0A193GN20_9BORD|nr:DUF882 domain-containing protein [Bordetella flabilis]ANN80896.1 hypothetical protein BAU07_26075 [Bordetella flabilis]